MRIRTLRRENCPAVFSSFQFVQVENRKLEKNAFSEQLLFNTFSVFNQFLTGFKPVFMNFAPRKPETQKLKKN